MSASIVEYDSETREPRAYPAEEMGIVKFLDHKLLLDHAGIEVRIWGFSSLLSSEHIESHCAALQLSSGAMIDTTKSFLVCSVAFGETGSLDARYLLCDFMDIEREPVLTWRPPVADDGTSPGPVMPPAQSMFFNNVPLVMGVNRLRDCEGEGQARLLQVKQDLTQWQELFFDAYAAELVVNMRKTLEDPEFLQTVPPEMKDSSEEDKQKWREQAVISSKIMIDAVEHRNENPDNKMVFGKMVQGFFEHDMLRQSQHEEAGTEPVLYDLVPEDKLLEIPLKERFHMKMNTFRRRMFDLWDRSAVVEYPRILGHTEFYWCRERSSELLEQIGLSIRRNRAPGSDGTFYECIFESEIKQLETTMQRVGIQRVSDSDDNIYKQEVTNVLGLNTPDPLLSHQTLHTISWGQQPQQQIELPYVLVSSTLLALPDYMGVPPRCFNLTLVRKTAGGEDKDPVVKHGFETICIENIPWRNKLADCQVMDADSGELFVREMLTKRYGTGMSEISADVGVQLKREHDKVPIAISNKIDVDWCDSDDADADAGDDAGASFDWTARVFVEPIISWIEKEQLPAEAVTAVDSGDAQPSETKNESCPPPPKEEQRKECLIKHECIVTVVVINNTLDRLMVKRTSPREIATQERHFKFIQECLTAD